jgi:hypothetical protein
MTSFVATAVETRAATARPSDEQWRGIWLRKLDKSLDDLNIDAAQAVRYRAAVGEFLFDNPGPPVAVADSAVLSFISKSAPGLKQAAAEALLFFYKNVVRSEKHAKFLSSVQDSPDKPASAADTLLEKLSQELRLRNYSRRTLKNYCAIVKIFWRGCREDRPGMPVKR